jgi:hypothetical protein
MEHAFNGSNAIEEHNGSNDLTETSNGSSLNNINKVIKKDQQCKKGIIDIS